MSEQRDLSEDTLRDIDETLRRYAAEGDAIRGVDLDSAENRGHRRTHTVVRALRLQQKLHRMFDGPVVRLLGTRCGADQVTTVPGAVGRERASLLLARLHALAHTHGWFAWRLLSFLSQEVAFGGADAFELNRLRLHLQRTREVVEGVRRGRTPTVIDPETVIPSVRFSAEDVNRRDPVRLLVYAQAAAGHLIRTYELELILLCGRDACGKTLHLPNLPADPDHERLCLVCHQARCNTTLVCGHGVLCGACLRHWQEASRAAAACPLCGILIS